MINSYKDIKNRIWNSKKIEKVFYLTKNRKNKGWIFEKKSQEIKLESTKYY